VAVNDGSNQETLDWKRRAERDGVTGFSVTPSSVCGRNREPGRLERERGEQHTQRERGT
jgi:hypothetical protein